MSELVGTVILEAKQPDRDNPGQRLSAYFEPPLAPGIGYRKSADGHSPSEIIRNDEDAIVELIYDRGVFGWSESEREPGFVQYWQKQQKRLGYVASGPLVEQYIGAPPVATAR